MADFMIVDLETENHPYYGQVASPHHPENYIVAPAFCLDDSEVFSWYFKNRAEADASDWFKIPDDVQYLVAHNAQFEIEWFLSRHRAEFERFIKRGGIVLCTQLAEYLLSSQTELYPALDDVAVRYGGTHKIDAVKTLWNQGVLTSQIDKALLLEYLAGPGGDIENTRRVAYGQIQRLQDLGMWDVFLLRCDALLHSAYCKFFGMFVDMPRALADKADLMENIERRVAALQRYLPEDIPDAEQFNWGSDYHLSALLFGGPIKFKIKVPYDPPKFEQVDAWQTDDGQYHLADDPASWGVPDSKFVRYKSGKNKGTRKVFRIDSDEEKLKWGEVIYRFPGIIDLCDLPSAVSEAFLSKRGEFRGKRHLCDRVEQVAPDGRVVKVLEEGTPVYSTSGEALEALAEHCDSELPKVLKSLADDQKICGTYYQKLLEETGPDGILRKGINHTSTITGRLSSAMQQMPRDGAVKAMYCSRFKDGNMLGCDFTALEVVHLAALSGDKNLLDALIAGKDMHIMRLASSLHRTYEELITIKKDESHPEHDLIMKLRQDVKPKSFQFQYGGTAKGMAFKIKGLSEEDAQEFIDNEMALFPESSAYRYLVEAEVKEHARTVGVLRAVADDGSFYTYKRAEFVAPSGTRYSFQQYRKAIWENGQKRMDLVFKISQLANYPCQGEASLVMQCASGLIIRWLVENDFFGGNILPVNTVHDAEYADVAPGYEQIAAKGIKYWMEYAPKYMAEIFPRYANLADIPYPAVPEIGPNLASQHHMEIH